MAYGQVAVTNATTGEIIYRDLTSEEIAQRDAERAQGAVDEARRQADDTAKQTDMNEIRGQKVVAAIQVIEDDLILLQGSPTTGQQKAILAGLLRRQKTIIKALAQILCTTEDV